MSSAPGSAPNDRPCQPRKLEPNDIRKGFDSGAPELDTWLERYASQNQRANNATTYVSVTPPPPGGGVRVVAFYAITVAGVSRDAVPTPVAKHAPSQVPCLLLARLAVDRQWGGQGLGAALLADAMRRAVQISETAGLRALLIHARDEAARAFYKHLGNFLDSPADPMHLMITIGDIEAAVRVLNVPVDDADWGGHRD